MSVGDLSKRVAALEKLMADAGLVHPSVQPRPTYFDLTHCETCGLWTGPDPTMCLRAVCPHRISPE